MRATVQRPVNVIDTTADANLTGSFATAAAPRPWAPAPTAKPTETGSLTPTASNNDSPRLAPRMPVTTTTNADSEGSAPVRRAPAKARGVVMHLVRGAKAVCLGANLNALTSNAELVSPKEAENAVVLITLKTFSLSIALYWYSWIPKLMIAGPNMDDMRSPAPFIDPDPKYWDRTAVVASPLSDPNISSNAVVSAAQIKTGCAIFFIFAGSLVPAM